MKQIAILYDNDRRPMDRGKAKELEGFLRKKKYTVSRYSVGSIEEMNRFLESTNPENCQFVIGFNLAGYQLETTGGLASINRLPMNMIQYITSPLEEMDELLKKTQSYMVTFCFERSGDEEEARRRYPHIWNTISCDSIDELAGAVDASDWRY